jgi:hypothetical protein
MYKLWILVFLTLAAADHIIGISYFQSSNCSGNPIIDNDALGWTTYNITPFQSFILNRTMMAAEQIDISATSVNGTECGQFLESFWNISAVCQPVTSPSTCIKYWNNTGPSAGIVGVGWGWNNITWVNTTKSTRRSRSLKKNLSRFS